MNFQHLLRDEPYINHLHIRKKYLLSMQRNLSSSPKGRRISYKPLISGDRSESRSQNAIIRTKRLETSGHTSEWQMNANIRRNGC